MNYFSIHPNGTMTKVDSLKSFATVEDPRRETLFADALQKKYGLAVPATFTIDGNLLIAANQQEAIAASNVFSQGSFSASGDAAPNMIGAFGRATNVLPFARLKPSIMGGYGPPALAA